MAAHPVNHWLPLDCVFFFLMQTIAPTGIVQTPLGTLRVTITDLGCSTCLFLILTYDTISSRLFPHTIPKDHFSGGTEQWEEVPQVDGLAILLLQEKIAMLSEWSPLVVSERICSYPSLGLSGVF